MTQCQDHQQEKKEKNNNIFCILDRPRKPWCLTASNPRSKSRLAVVVVVVGGGGGSVGVGILFSEESKEGAQCKNTKGTEGSLHSTQTYC